MWLQFNRVFEEIDEFFEQFDSFFEEAKKANPNVHIDNPNEQQVRFRAKTWRERLRFAWNFFGMTLSMVFKGHATVVFRRRKPIK